MCGRGDVDYSARKIREAFADLGELEINIDLTAPRHNVSPTDPVPVAHREDGHLRVDGVRWGTVEGKGRRPLLLVRSESVAHGSLASRTRGLVLFSKFYEWQGAKGTKRKPFAIAPIDGRILALAALVKRTISDDGEVTESCAIVTQPARGRLVEIHDRMPVLVDRAQLAAWLDPPARTDAALALALRDQEAIAASLEAFEEDPLAVARAARGVGR